MTSDAARRAGRARGDEPRIVSEHVAERVTRHFMMAALPGTRRPAAPDRAAVRGSLRRRDGDGNGAGARRDT